LISGKELKVVTGVDDHSRYCVIAAVVPRATSRAVCAAFVQALSRFGCPEQVLTDNGKQFTGRFGKPRPAEVLFERICRRNGIRTILTKPRSPTTTGKVERFHQTLQGDCFAVHGAFPDLPAAQQAVDAFVAEYNHHRPHQALDDQVPASRFAPIPAEQRHLLGLDVPAELVDTPPAPPEANAVGTPPPMLDPDPWQVAEAEDTHGFLTAAEHWLGGEAIEVDRVVPASGNLAVGGQQFWIGTVHAGHQVRLWMDTTTVHLTLVDSMGGAHLKTIPSRQTTVTLARLRADGARPAGPPPVPAVAARATGPSAAIEIDRVVNANGLVGIAGRYVSVGQPLARPADHPTDRRQPRPRHRRRRPGPDHPRAGARRTPRTTARSPPGGSRTGRLTAPDQSPAPSLRRGPDPGRRADPARRARPPQHPRRRRGPRWGVPRLRPRR
jgi:hypothetical protein